MHKSITLNRITAAVERAAHSLDNPGFCASCGVAVEGIEPDAEHYECEECGKPQVYGAEQLLIMLA